MINFRVLGKPGWDNGLFITINSGTRVYRLLFDCGENILKDVYQHDIKSIDHLFFSHLHIDHIAGFDYFFRRNYDRGKKPVYIYGPTDTIEIIHNRLQGYKWNLVDGMPGIWNIFETDGKKLSESSFKTSDGFKVKYPVEKKVFNGLLIDNPDFSVSIVLLNHIIPSIGYFVKEKPSLNINKNALENTGLLPGPWLGKVRDLSIDSGEMIVVNNNSFKLKTLREKLLVKKEGESIGYLTDFIYNIDTSDKIKTIFRGCDLLVCESQYRSSEKEFAVKNYHLISRQAARLAKNAGVKKLILFHISDRYKIKDYPSLLNEAREIFPETYFPVEWKIKY